jgi:O-antigen/teichoic acid export membrane protein
MAAEPFFFKQSTDKNAPRTYARVMKFFVMACSLMWLGIVLAMPLIMKLAYGENLASYQEGSGIIPILAMASVFLGIYYNLSIWYKLTNRTWSGAWITLGGAAVTIVLNIWWIPRFGYVGSAWATFTCYALMMVVSYQLGQRHYPVPYAWKKYLAYLLIAALIGSAFMLYADSFAGALWQQLLTGAVLFMAYLVFLLKMEKKDFATLPVVGRFIARL